MQHENNHCQYKVPVQRNECLVLSKTIFLNARNI